MATARASHPDSDPRELRRQIVEARFCLTEKRLDKLEDSVARIEVIVLESKAMLRAWLLAASAFWALLVVTAGFLLKVVGK